MPGTLLSCTRSSCTRLVCLRAVRQRLLPAAVCAQRAVLLRCPGAAPDAARAGRGGGCATGGAAVAPQAGRLPAGARWRRRGRPAAAPRAPRARPRWQQDVGGRRGLDRPPAAPDAGAAPGCPVTDSVGSQRLKCAPPLAVHSLRAAPGADGLPLRCGLTSCMRCGVGEAVGHPAAVPGRLGSSLRCGPRPAARMLALRAPSALQMWYIMMCGAVCVWCLHQSATCMRLPYSAYYQPRPAE